MDNTLRQVIKKTIKNWIAGECNFAKLSEFLLCLFVYIDSWHRSLSRDKAQNPNFIECQGTHRAESSFNYSNCAKESLIRRRFSEVHLC